MKGIVTDLAAGTHGKNRLPSRLERSAKKFAMFGTRPIASAGIRSFICQTRPQLLVDDLGDRRSVTRQARKRRTQGAFTRRTQFAADRIIVMQIERA
jgi:hypothetical protein